LSSTCLVAEAFLAAPPPFSIFFGGMMGGGGVVQRSTALVKVNQVNNTS
jgi:hypothetical protein